MEQRYKDTDLREALRRRYADVPQLPADFMATMEQRLQQQTVAKRRQLWGRVAAVVVAVAASVAVAVVMVGGDSTKTADGGSTVAVVGDSTPVAPIKEKGVPLGNVVAEAAPSATKPTAKAATIPLTSVATASATATTASATADTATVTVASTTAPAPTASAADLALHCAAYSPQQEDSAYQDPGRVDEFIEKMAHYHHVKEGELTCAVATDSAAFSKVYVFPDKKEIDVFGRLLQVACWYSDETPGYLLNFSHQQFFFQLKDMRKQLQYRWIAERINGKILLYGTNAPIGVQTSSACYQEFRNQLMHTNSINLKTREI